MQQHRGVQHDEHGVVAPALLCQRLQTVAHVVQHGQHAAGKQQQVEQGEQSCAVAEQEFQRAAGRIERAEEVEQQRQRKQHTEGNGLLFHAGAGLRQRLLRHAGVQQLHGAAVGSGDLLHRLHGAGAQLFERGERFFVGLFHRVKQRLALADLQRIEHAVGAVAGRLLFQNRVVLAFTLQHAEVFHQILAALLQPGFHLRFVHAARGVLVVIAVQHHLAGAEGRLRGGLLRGRGRKVARFAVVRLRGGRGFKMARLFQRVRRRGRVALDRRQPHRKQQRVDVVDAFFGLFGSRLRLLRLLREAAILQQTSGLGLKIFAEQVVFLELFCHYAFPFPVSRVR